MFPTSAEGAPPENSNRGGDPDVIPEQDPAEDELEELEGDETEFDFQVAVVG